MTQYLQTDLYYAAGVPSLKCSWVSVQSPQRFLTSLVNCRFTVKMQIHKRQLVDGRNKAVITIQSFQAKHFCLF